MLINILITIFLVLLNGFFVAAEFALVKVRASQLELRAQTGNKLAMVAHKMTHKLDAYLSATQLGITLASLGLGWVGEGVVSEIIIALMHAMGFEASPEVAHSIALPISFALITILHIVFGELAPKSLAIQRPESTSLAIAYPLKFFYFLFQPAIWTLNGFSNFILRLMGIAPMHGSEVHTADELRLLFEQSKESGQIQDSQHELIENVFQFSDRMVKQVMVPRTNVVGLEINFTADKIMEVVFAEGYTRMPVYRENIDNVVGVLYVKDLLIQMRKNEPIELEKLMRKAYFVPETKKINRLLQEFQRKRMHMAIVTDEFGGVAGLITIEDIIEELVGEIQDEYDEENPLVEKIGNFEFRIKGSAAISDVNAFLPYQLPEGEDYETMSGFINMIFGHIPEKGETMIHDVYEVKILEKSERKIELVQLKVTEDKRDDIL
ncbi:hemolysin family protein [Adhaeribacter soli]|uniref:HlyC/CorC family transporter n=1 Tax=Adhaeribacter soli TaxID=2607655 RepID=A0A5N1IM22_9BACT|nr:hemolysin family protein [Adhaeribacter soli]KAA9331122.1 HlyC/CorC family transporter [Adhaeribacter soli]